jgi:LysM repeat protein
MYIAVFKANRHDYCLTRQELMCLVMKNPRKIAVVFALCVTASLMAQANVGSGRQAIMDYISQYESIAVTEMQRTGIPASIKLAQGILESNAGRSYLAVEGNNHFGIKCGSQWGGDKVYRKDDDYDKRGKLRQSCFRAYMTVEESYVAHSNFLTDYKKARRYGFLFKLDSDDYKSWARGLKKSGYATNPKYASLLINIIESYDLDRYDHVALAAEEKIIDKPVAPEESVVEIENDDRLIESRSDDNGRFFAGTADTYKFRTHNGVAFVQADIGDKLYVVAMDLGLDVKDLIAYNDGAYDRNEEIAKGQRIYVEQKAARFKGTAKKHRVSDGETMVDIAQLYGIRLEKLYVRNRMEPGSQAAVGQQISLNKKRKKQDVVKLRKPVRLKSPIPESPPTEAAEQVETIIEPANSSNPINKPIEEPMAIPVPVTPEPDTSNTRLPAQTIEPKEESIVEDGLKRMHVVSKGETLYSISKLYNTTVDQLKELNSLDSNTLKISQELIIE